MNALEAVFILLGVVLALISLAAWVWAIVDAAKRPDLQWKTAGQSKALWLAVVVGTGALGCLSFGCIGALLYALIARPALKRAESALARPPYDPPPYDRPPYEPPPGYSA